MGRHQDERFTFDFAVCIFIVSFPDGYSDTIKLGKHFFDDKDRMADENDCRYFGHLENERDACVAMTGCVGSEDILFTIMSAHAPGTIHSLWTKEGNVETLDAERLPQNTDFSGIQKNVNSVSSKYPYFINRKFEDDVCYYLKPPATAQLNIKVAFTEFVYNDAERNFTRAEINAKRMLTHVQTLYCHPSLGMKIHTNL